MPRQIEIKADVFESLCFIQCTLAEIAYVCHCSEDTIERWCKRNYGETFAESYKKHSAGGKVSLRRLQYRSAENGNVAMQIFLGKQWLGQKDNPETSEMETAIDKLSELLKNQADAARKDVQP